MQFGPRQKRRRDDSKECRLPFLEASRGDSHLNDQAERKRDQGGFIFKRRFVKAVREMSVRQDVW